MVYSGLEDSTLIKFYAKGDENALEVLIRRHKERIYHFLLSKLKDSALAEDLFQDTFIKVINTIKTKRYNEEGKFIQWVMRIAHNLVIDHFRREKKKKHHNSFGEFDIFDFVEDTGLNAEAMMIRDQIRKDVGDMVKLLPEEQRDVLYLRIYEELSFKEISEQTGVSINTALGRMRYALINLRKLIEKHNIILTD